MIRTVCVCFTRCARVSIPPHPLEELHHVQPNLRRKHWQHGFVSGTRTSWTLPRFRWCRQCILLMLKPVCHNKHCKNGPPHVAVMQPMRGAVPASRCIRHQLDGCVANGSCIFPRQCCRRCFRRCDCCRHLRNSPTGSGDSALPKHAGGFTVEPEAGSDVKLRPAGNCGEPVDDG